MQKYISITILIIVIIIGTGLRVWRLIDFPSIMGDEATNGEEIIRVLNDPYITVFFPNNTGREALFFYLSIPVFMILGPTLFALRSISILAGILLIPLSYRWAKILLPKSKRREWIALITAILIATSPWALYNSRVGLRGGLLPVFMLGAYIFFWKGYLNRQIGWFVVSGIFLGLCSYIYTSSRLLPLTFVGFGISLLIYGKSQEKYIKLTWKGIVIVGCVAFVVFLPLGGYFFCHPDSFLSRTMEVSLLGEYYNGDHLTNQHILVYLLSSWKQFITFFIQLTTPWMQNQTWPLPIRIFPLIFWLGLVRAVYLTRNHTSYSFLLISFFVGMLPIFYTFPTTLRNVLALPPTYLLQAIGAYFIIETVLFFKRQTSNRQTLFSLVALLSLLFISTLSASNLFRFENWIVGLSNVPQERWVNMAHLPTVADHTINTTTQRIKHLVLHQRQSVLIPYSFYDETLAKFLFQSNFDLSNPIENQYSTVQPSESISIIWSPLFNEKPKNFFLISPTTKEGFGQVTLIGEWASDSLPMLIEILYNNQSKTNVIYNVNDQSVGFFVEADYEKIVGFLQPTDIDLHIGTKK
ncbi:glycosyltransferase family 39 protein [Anaerolineales bacterium HSG6]|nr:glycosyltransferase family 39 protein [Anaerolineales bacterium HSG6]MDM8532242.1 glycosyltransferase family 39 protein [Anaerolineales bacterium HSG25]